MENRIYRWALWTLEAVSVGVLVYIAVPQSRYLFQGAVRVGMYHGRQLARHLRRSSAPSWVQELGEVRDL